MNLKEKHVAAVVLAAGKGTRLGCTDIPKVMLEIANRPMVSYTIDTLEELGLLASSIVLVVGYQRLQVKDYFGTRVTYAEQEQQLGTAHAAYVGMRELELDVEHVVVMGGDDSAFYTPRTLERLVEQHLATDCVLSLLTSRIDRPMNLGRVLRDDDGEFIGVVEKENMTEAQKQIDEISTGTFVFNRVWYERIFPTMPKIPGLGEFGLPMAIEMVRQEGCNMQAIELENSNEWFGINTLEELSEANRRKEGKKERRK